MTYTEQDYVRIRTLLEDKTHVNGRATNDEVLALFKHMIATDTLPNNPQYEVTALVLERHGKLPEFKINEERYYNALILGLLIGILEVSPEESEDEGDNQQHDYTTSNTVQ